MEIIKTMKPGARGTKRLLRKYKDQLVAVRYRKKANENKAYTTVELIIDEREYEPGVNCKAINAIKRHALIPIKIAYKEIELRENVKQAGGMWHQEDKVWLLPHCKVIELNLSKRIVEKDVSKYGHEEFVF